MGNWIRYNVEEGWWEIAPHEGEPTFAYLRENFPLQVEFRRWVEFHGFRERRPASFDEGSRIIQLIPCGQAYFSGPGFDEFQGSSDFEDVSFDSSPVLPSTDLAPPVAPSGRGRIYYDTVDNKFKASQNGGAYTDLLKTRKYCWATRSAAKTISTATFTTIDFDSEQADPGGFHDNATNNDRFTAPESGFYIITCVVTWATNATGTRQLLINHSSGATIAYQIKLATTGGFWRSTNELSVGIPLNAGEYITAQVYQDSGGNLSLEQNGSYSPYLAISLLN